jgi:hypothetical protein
MLRGYDLVTALVVVPALAIAAHRAWHSSVLAHLTLASLLGCVVHIYTYYLFGTGFNNLFPLHAAAFSAGSLRSASPCPHARRRRGRSASAPGSRNV